jgi:hypothetical protein
MPTFTLRRYSYYFHFPDSMQGYKLTALTVAMIKQGTKVAPIQQGDFLTQLV